MRNSLIIQSGDATFDTYYKQMVKRKVAQAITQSFTGGLTRALMPGGTSSGLDIMSPRGKTILFVKGKRPPARDGHSAIVHNGQFIIFGGDRHIMPFNDLFVLDLEAEFSLKQSMFE